MNVEADILFIVHKGAPFVGDHANDDSLLRGVPFYNAITTVEPTNEHSPVSATLVQPANQAPDAGCRVDSNCIIDPIFRAFPAELLYKAAVRWSMLSLSRQELRRGRDETE